MSRVGGQKTSSGRVQLLAPRLHPVSRLSQPRYRGTDPQQVLGLAFATTGRPMGHPEVVAAARRLALHPHWRREDALLSAGVSFGVAVLWRSFAG
jgi:hypothetical protein